LSLEILEIVGWSTNNDNFKPFASLALGPHGLQRSILFLLMHFGCQNCTYKKPTNILYILISAF
jgi:hypothetical protein